MDVCVFVLYIRKCLPHTKATTVVYVCDRIAGNTQPVMLLPSLVDVVVALLLMYLCENMFTILAEI